MANKRKQIVADIAAPRIGDCQSSYLEESDSELLGGDTALEVTSQVLVIVLDDASDQI